MRSAPLGKPLFTVHAMPREGVLRLYRVVCAEEALERAFVSNHAKGARPRGPELESTLIHRGVSMYVTRERAANRAQTFPNIGDCLAEVALPAGATTNVAPTGRDAEHVTVWADPATLAACVTRILPIEEEP